MSLFDLSSWLPTVHAEAAVEVAAEAPAPVVVEEEEEAEDPEDHMPGVVEGRQFLFIR